MIERYTGRQMGALWSDQARFERYLEVELCAAEEVAALGRIPADEVRVLRQRARVDVARIAEIEAEVRHDVIAFVSQVAESVGPEGRWLHYGLTSSDVVDTALSMAMVRAADLLLAGIGALRHELRRRAAAEAHTLTVGRTHGVHAEPITFGLKLARHDDALRRDEERLGQARAAVAVGKLSGAVGTYAHLPPEVEARVCTRLGLSPVPIAGQVIDRDRHAHYMTTLAILAGDLENLALEVRHLQRTEVAEAFEPFAAGQKGSSAMPHKRNPVNAEKVCGLARLVRGLSVAALEEIALWHERDISHSSVERVILPDATIALDHMLTVMTGIVAGMEIDRERMAANLALTDRRILSERVLLALVDAGLAREEAYRVVQRAALDPSPGFADRLAADPMIMAKLGSDQVAQLLDPGDTVRHVDTILARVGVRPTAGTT